jgi:hypothetical protein
MNDQHHFYLNGNTSLSGANGYPNTEGARVSLRTASYGT